MSQAAKKYEICDEYIEIAKKLRELHMEMLFDCNPDEIVCHMVVNKERPEKTPIIKVSAVPEPLNVSSSFAHYVILFESDWRVFDDRQKANVVMKSMLRMTMVEDVPKLISPDLYEFLLLVRTLGVDYMDDDSSPNLLTDTINWQLDPISYKK